MIYEETMSANEFHLKAESTGVFPYRWGVVLCRRIERPRGVTEYRVLVSAGGWAWTSAVQERRVQEAMELCRRYVADAVAKEAAP